jgi:glycine dehydrogenase subunit 1
VERGILGGLPLGDLSEDLADALLVCATEKRTEADIAAYGQALEEVLQA